MAAGRPEILVVTLAELAEECIRKPKDETTSDQKEN